jgi:hypothetical protein
MREVGRAILMLCALSGSVRTLAGDDRGVDKQASQVPTGYSSPQEAFQARRTAIARRDWRTSYSSMTPELQDQTVMELGDAWIYLESDLETPWDRLGKAAREAALAKFRVIMKKHGLELQKVEVEYKKRYRELHGVDLDKISAERRKRNRELLEARWKEHPEERQEFEKLLKEHPEVLEMDPAELHPGEKPGPNLPETDRELMEKVISSVIFSQLIDRAGLYEEASEFLTAKVKYPEGDDYVLGGNHVFGDLQGVTVSGDTARGWVDRTHYVDVNGVKKASKPERVLRRFRRLNGRWYNDNREDDQTRYDGPRDR